MRTNLDAILLGHRGFVGSAIANHLRARGLRYLAVDRQSYASARGSSAALLINANGSSDKRLAISDPLGSFRRNVDAAMASLSDFACERYVLVSSVDVYNSLSDSARNHEASVIDPLGLSAYGFIKHLTELAVMRFSRRWLILRLGPLVGPNLRKNPIFDLLERRTLYLHPDSRLSFIDTREVASLLWRLLEVDREIFNVAGRGTVRLGDVAASAGVELGSDVRSYEVHQYAVNVDKLCAIAQVPSSAATVSAFLHERLAERGARPSSLPTDQA